MKRTDVMDTDEIISERNDSIVRGELQGNLGGSEQGGKPEGDLTGRDRLVSNVLFSWAAYFVFIIAGFIMPRMIDRRLGQESLGVWDFAWSLVGYFGLVQAGIGSSVNRYVARYWAAKDIAGVNRTVSSASFVVGIAGMLVLGMTAAVSLLLPRLFGGRLGENVPEAQWVVFFLGISLGLQISLNVFIGVLTGCHRWGLHNMITSGWHLVTVAGMIVALLLGGGLPTVAIVTFLGQFLADVTRVIAAYRVCEGLQLRPSLIKLEMIGRLFVFGGKTLVPSVSNLLLNQTTGIMIVAYLGPAALALYSRPRSLMLHINTLVDKMAMVLVPTTSSLQRAGDMERIQDLSIKAVRYSFYMVLPMVLVLVLFGGPILQLWMGSRYANGLVPAILAAGSLATMVQKPVLMILAGMNAHGRAGMAQFVASLCSVGLTILVLGYLKWGLAGAAFAVTLPLAIMNMVYLPLLICRRIGLNMGRYFVSVSAGPVIHVLPFAICLVAARIAFSAEPTTGLIWGGTAGGTILAVLYFQYVLPDRIKMRVLRLMGLGGSAA